MLTILLVEDNSVQLNALKIIIKEYEAESYILCAPNYYDALIMIKENKIDLFILDIELSTTNPQENGIELAKYIRNIPGYIYTPIVFLSFITEKVQIALNDTHCYNYIIKPYVKEDIYKTLDSILRSPLMQNEPFSFIDDQRINIRLEEESILFIQADGHKIFIQTDSDVYVTVNETMETIIAKLSKTFIRCHKKYIVNLKKIRNYDKTNRLITLNNERIPIGRSFKNDFEERFYI